MRKFTTYCKDEKTGYEMVLSECSMNMALDWLFDEMLKHNRDIYRTEYNFRTHLLQIWTGESHPGNNYLGQFEVHWTHQRMFFYDEERGYLLGD